MLPRKRALVSVAILLAFMACGREAPFHTIGMEAASPSPVTTPSPTDSPSAGGANDERQEFIDAANAICREYIERTDGLGEPEGPYDYARWLRELIAILTALQSKFRTLVPPDADREAVDRYLEFNDAQVTILERALPELETAVSVGDWALADAIMTDAFMKFNLLAEAQEPFVQSYDLVSCGAPDPSIITA